MVENIEILEFLEQINYALSLEFKEKWRHRYSSSFIELFQKKMLDGLTRQKPIKKEVLINFFVKRYKYNSEFVKDFFSDIDIEIYRPMIY